MHVYYYIYIIISMYVCMLTNKIQVSAYTSFNIQQYIHTRICVYAVYLFNCNSSIRTNCIFVLASFTYCSLLLTPLPVSSSSLTTIQPLLLSSSSSWIVLLPLQTVVCYVPVYAFVLLVIEKFCSMKFCWLAAAVAKYIHICTCTCTLTYTYNHNHTIIYLSSKSFLIPLLLLHLF